MTDPLLAREVRALYAVTSALNAGMSERAVLDALLERTVTELGYTAATVRLVDEERQTLELRAAVGLSETYLAKGPVAVGRSGIDRAVLAGQTVVVSDVQHDPGFQYGRAASREGLASALMVPLLAYEHVIGVLRVYTATRHIFSPEEQALLGAVANLGAQASCRAQRAVAYRTIAREIVGSLDLRSVLSSLLARSVRELRVRAGSIRLLGPRRLTLHLAAATGLSAAYLQKGAVEVARSMVDQHVIRGGEPLAITEVTPAAGLQYPAEAQREGIRAMLVVPLRVPDLVIGVLRLYSGQARHFGEEEIAFAATVAELGALALENARLHAALKARFDAVAEDANGWYRYLTLS